RHIHSPIPKRKKEEPTSHSGEPLCAQNPQLKALLSAFSSHFSTLSPNRTKIPMASTIEFKNRILLS
ncbi:MAG: hypothetical protein NC398_09370, partial [Acetatifactor muris]|nr:hypothetical protein [Acetatifactor muris]